MKLPVEALSSLQHISPIADASIGDLQNNNGSSLSHMTGCYTPESGILTISPQDALVALGRLASPSDFFDTQAYRSFTVLRTWRTAAIALIQIDTGPDEFSLFDVATQAIEITKFCIIHQPPGIRLGGALEVGSQNRFRVVVRGRLP